MHDSENNSASDDDGDERANSGWNEFHWERYLREQDAAVAEYWRCYQGVGARPDRIDEVARRLGWELAEDESTDFPMEDDGGFDEEPYTVHRNHVFVATRALFTGVAAVWAEAASDPALLPPEHAVPLASALHQAELLAVSGVQSLELGDQALGIAQLKRALARLNDVLSHLPSQSNSPTVECRLAELRNQVLPWLFDLREIFLRVVYECRAEMGREVDDDNEA